jgi:beta-mannosidase
MIRKEKKTFANERTAAHFTIETELEIWAANSTLVRKNVTLEVTSFDLHTSWLDKWSTAVELAENASTELYKGLLPGQPRRRKVSDIPKDIVVSARLLDEAGVVLARHCNWYCFSISVYSFIAEQIPLTGQSRTNSSTSLPHRNLV